MIHLAAGYFFGGGVDEAELADCEVAVVVAHGRAEGAALHGAGGVEIAGTGGGVEDGAGLIVGEVFEGFFVVRFGEERTGGGVAGEVGREALARGGGAGADAVADGGVGGGEGGAEGLSVERRDGEDADTALVAAGAAGEPVAGAHGGRGERGVDEGQEFRHSFSVAYLMRGCCELRARRHCQRGSNASSGKCAQIRATMEYHETPLGKNVRFLLPSLKLKQPSTNGDTIEQCVHFFLMENFGGYTATSANLFGYWKEEDGEHTYGEHREFVVALPNDKGLPELKEFLGKTARMLDEKCLYFEVAGVAVLLYAGPAAEQVQGLCA